MHVCTRLYRAELRGRHRRMRQEPVQTWLLQEHSRIVQVSRTTSLTGSPPDTLRIFFQRKLRSRPFRRNHRCHSIFRLFLFHDFIGPPSSLLPSASLSLVPAAGPSADAHRVNYVLRINFYHRFARSCYPIEAPPIVSNGRAKLGLLGIEKSVLLFKTSRAVRIRAQRLFPTLYLRYRVRCSPVKFCLRLLQNCA